MATAPMSNRRPKRPYGGFLRSKRRSRLDTLAMLESASAPPVASGGRFGRAVSMLFKRLFGRR